MDVTAPAIEKLKEDLSLIEEKVVLGYTLADAIREGAAVTRQGHRTYVRDGACALGAAWIAARARGYISDPEQ